MTQLPPGAIDFWDDPEEWKKHFGPDYADPENWHEATKPFPLMSKEQLGGLAESIRQEGLKHPIVLFEGKVLDGRNRAKACKLAGVKLKLAPAKPASPLAFVAQENVERLHLKPGQLVGLAYELIPRLRAEAEQRQKAAGKYGTQGGRGHKKEKPSAQNDAEGFGKAAKLAGRAYGVSTGSVEAAIRIAKANPDLIKKLISGDLTLPQADKIAHAKDPLHERFVVPPRTVLDAKQKYWTDRLAGWHSIGVSGGHDDSKESKFDPVLAEAVYRWFMPMEGGHVLDPFAGEAIKGLVAGCRGLYYTGIEVREEQVSANRLQAAQVQAQVKLKGLDMRLPEWIEGNSENLEKLLPSGKMYDLLFTSPPYGDLEVYEEDVRNLSAESYDKFLPRYRKIIRLAVRRLKPNRFAVFKVGDVRDDKGFYDNFVGDTITCFLEEGLKLYNWAIYTMPPGDPRQQNLDPFRTTRKLGNKGVGHQHVLCFFNGDDASVITQEFGILDEENLSSRTRSASRKKTGSQNGTK